MKVCCSTVLASGNIGFLSMYRYVSCFVSGVNFECWYVLAAVKGSACVNVGYL